MTLTRRILLPLLLLLSAGAQTGKHRTISATAAPSFVFACGTQSGSSTTTAISCGFNLNPNGLVVIYAFGFGGTVATPSDSKVLIWHSFVSSSFFGGGTLRGWWALTGSKTGSDTFTVSLSGGGESFVDLYVGIYSGTDLSSPFDVNQFHSGTTVSAGGTISSGNFTTAQANELIVIYCAALNNIGTATFVNSPYTQHFQALFPDIMSVGDGIAVSAGTNVAGCTITNSTTQYMVNAVAFK